MQEQCQKIPIQTRISPAYREQDELERQFNSVQAEKNKLEVLIKNLQFTNQRLIAEKEEDMEKIQVLEDNVVDLTYNKENILQGISLSGEIDSSVRSEYNIIKNAYEKLESKLSALENAKKQLEDEYMEIYERNLSLENLQKRYLPLE